jgi:hypothetical protein
MHAVDMAKNGEKKLFVFMAGEPGTPNAYRAIPAENQDLKDWRGSQQPEDNIEKMKVFRARISVQHTAIFTNLDVFRKQLKETLTQNIDDLGPSPVKKGSDIAIFFAHLTPRIKKCNEHVRLLATSKEIHDHLHETLHYGIRPLSDEILPIWEQDVELSPAREKQLWAKVGVIEEQKKLIELENRGIPCEDILHKYVAKLLAQPNLWSEYSEANKEGLPPDLRIEDITPDFAAFSEKLNIFSVFLQQAFIEADSRMMKAENDLGDCYASLRESLVNADQQKGLNPEDQDRITFEREQIDKHRGRVRDTLTMHHRWQKHHDALYELSDFLEIENQFKRKYNAYAKARAPAQLELVDSSLKQHFPDGLEPDKNDVSEYNFFVNLKSLRDAIDSVINSAEREDIDEIVDLFINWRSHFDDAFFSVDKRTMLEVQRAKERANNTDDWLLDLSQQI